MGVQEEEGGHKEEGGGIPERARAYQEWGQRRASVTYAFLERETRQGLLKEPHRMGARSCWGSRKGLELEQQVWGGRGGQALTMERLSCALRLPTSDQSETKTMSAQEAELRRLLGLRQALWLHLGSGSAPPRTHPRAGLWGYSRGWHGHCSHDSLRGRSQVRDGRFPGSPT